MKVWMSATLLLAGLICVQSCLCFAAEPEIVVPSQKRALTLGEFEDAVGFIEMHVHMPEGAQPAATYGRYYAQEDGMVRGEYVSLGSSFNTSWTAGVHYVSSGQLPLVFDGGCQFLTVWYVPGSEVVHATCHGFG